jgi:hypothetical protein
MQLCLLKKSSRQSTLLLLLGFWQCAEKSIVLIDDYSLPTLRSTIYTLKLKFLTYHDATNLFRKKTNTTIFLRFIIRKRGSSRIFSRRYLPARFKLHLAISLTKFFLPLTATTSPSSDSSDIFDADAPSASSRTLHRPSLSFHIYICKILVSTHLFYIS